MNLSKSNYTIITKFGTLNDFKAKLKIENILLEEVINTLDKDGASLLENSLVSRKFDISKFLLDNNARVNVISSIGCNELHYIAPNINQEGAIEIAQLLIDRNVELEIKENKYGNSALFSLCQEVLKVRSQDGLRFIEKCIKKVENIDDCNKMGYSVRRVIKERGTEELKKIVEGK